MSGIPYQKRLAATKAQFSFRSSVQALRDTSIFFMTIYSTVPTTIYLLWIIVSSIVVLTGQIFSITLPSSTNDNWSRPVQPNIISSSSSPSSSPKGNDLQLNRPRRSSARIESEMIGSEAASSADASLVKMLS
ncbi:hypothetical protein BGZ73_003262 [Actinomortierella ambigua]|nr:hypothetical protein BGZ73_003262 [Actinomortierella ambigua]